MFRFDLVIDQVSNFDHKESNQTKTFPLILVSFCTPLGLVAYVSHEFDLRMNSYNSNNDKRNNTNFGGFKVINLFIIVFYLLRIIIILSEKRISLIK